VQLNEAASLNSKHFVDEVRDNSLNEQCTLVVCVVSTAEWEDIRPLTDRELTVIRRNRNQLVDFIDPENGLLHELEFRRCISMQQRRRIQAAGESTEKNHKLLEILTRKSHNRFIRFLDCLSKTGQSHIVGLFTGLAGTDLCFVELVVFQEYSVMFPLTLIFNLSLHLLDVLKNSVSLAIKKKSQLTENVS
jgi:hypothetical protein